MNDHIIIKGARQHNLKNIDLKIPKNKLVVITGVSGSGKSTLAFDTLYAEGQRRYVESLSAYARQFLEMMEKPDVDSIEYLSPAISIEQKSISRNPRSTVGTITEIYDYMRLLFARAGAVHCPVCGKLVQSYSVQQIVDRVLAFGEDAKVEIMAPVVRGKKGEYKKLFEKLLKDGYVRAVIDGEVRRLEEPIELDKQVKHSISVVIDRIKIKESVNRRLTDSVETALGLGEGLVEVMTDDRRDLYSQKFTCPDCDISIEEIEPRSFSFNNPFGACPECEGLGEKQVFDTEAIVPNDEISVREGAIEPWQQFDNFHFYNTLVALSEQFGIDMNKPYRDLTEKHKKILLEGLDEPIKMFTFKGEKKVFYDKKFNGVFGLLKEKLYTGTQTDRDFAKKYMSAQNCPSCDGARLKRTSLSVFVGGKNIAEISAMNVREVLEFFEGVTFDGFIKDVAAKIINEIKRRLKFLNDVGLSYITLERKASTLSGGEAQRIRLATQIGSGLTDVLYVLDEPSIGLHQRDNDMLIATLKNLRDIGNSLIVVEHDEDTIYASDFVVDMGPGAGRKGGEVVFTGHPEELKHCEGSLTGQYLSGRKAIEMSAERRKPDGRCIELAGATENNLKDISVKIPLGLNICVTGVSGSGKSTLIMDTLQVALKKKLLRNNARSGAFRDLTGVEQLDKVIDIDQSPIGRTPRSNPSTYTGVFTDIREIFAMTQDAKVRGYKISRFSFNVKGPKGGRCETCQGEGYIKIEMHFLPDMYVKCDACHGKRYNRDTLDIRYKGQNIADVMDMTVNQGFEFFENIPKLKNKLAVLKDVGLGYIKLGQPATTLSGGEAQRVKLAKELMKRPTGKTLYIFDEPTTGLHFDDINKLVKIFARLTDSGNTVIIIEHNLDVIKCADHIIDLGPEGGEGGGEIVFEGTPEDCAKCKASYTGKYLKGKLVT
ncbi:excinuclease ABC, A subunit [Denitrovibrio acetiphilus DSM 12809]|uniref:UvrABC system protein A n=1 Tax=Denitrovibrio acetiphilus (strain DSM 12809 / NBRC 114555 / N2460) TaxID=522772 RepID=D4H6B4_DENA2|nr:excinuclease ABC subunit UvrA [Denitrovibrio acetiphilus]ADD69588.1 excinuclease ABC, A subunit [Denitrovibrio acetiphilus DSM 12809]